MRYLTLLLIAVATLAGVSCIKNDIPYPVVVLNIESITGDGFTVEDIDQDKRIVTLTLEEQTDIRNVQINQVKITEGATPSRELTGTFDLRTPIYVTLSLYQEYEWTIIAEQPIERSFEVGGQVGKTVFDLPNRTVTTYVAKNADLSEVTVNSLKLGPAAITTYSPTAAELSGTSFETVRFVDVTAHGLTDRWMLYVLPTTKSVELTAANAWSRVVWLEGAGIEGTPMGFRYRKKGDQNWLPIENLIITGGSFEGWFEATPETFYEVLAYCGEEQTDPREVVTGTVPQLPNTGFEDWCTIKDVVYPYASGGEIFWGTGNPGANLAGETLTDKLDDPRPGSQGKYCANLKSKYVTVLGLGKFAAGNLFVGRYAETAGTNGILTFGRSFVTRPRIMRIWYKYKQGTIDKLGSKPANVDIKIGDPDQGHIYIALGTWTKEEYGMDSKGKMVGTDDSPVCVDTRSQATFFNPKGKDVVAFGELVINKSVDTWMSYDIEIQYNDKGIIPTNLIVVGSASRYGDYFTGSTKSEMWIDDFELIY